MAGIAHPIRLTVVCDGKLVPQDHRRCRGWIASTGGWVLCQCPTCRHDPEVAGESYTAYMRNGNGIPRQRSGSWTPGG